MKYQVMQCNECDDYFLWYVARDEDGRRKGQRVTVLFEKVRQLAAEKKQVRDARHFPFPVSSKVIKMVMEQR